MYFDISQVNGIKAISSFAVIPKFDLALGFPVDWMHCVLLGVSKSLMNFWILSKYHKGNFYLGNKVRFYNHNFNNMKNLSVFYCFHKLSIKINISRNNHSKLWLIKSTWLTQLIQTFFIEWTMQDIRLIYKYMYIESLESVSFMIVIFR